MYTQQPLDLEDQVILPVQCCFQFTQDWQKEDSCYWSVYLQGKDVPSWGGVHWRWHCPGPGDSSVLGWASISRVTIFVTDSTLLHKIIRSQWHGFTCVCMHNSLHPPPRLLYTPFCQPSLADTDSGKYTVFLLQKRSVHLSVRVSLLAARNSSIYSVCFSSFN